MATLSAFLFFISQHAMLAFPLWIIAGLALGAALSVLRKNGAWLGLGAVGFVRLRKYLPRLGGQRGLRPCQRHLWHRAPLIYAASCARRSDDGPYPC